MRLSQASSMLCVVDVQERLVPAVMDGASVVARCRRLAEAARLLEVATVVTEQYRKGLGPTVPELSGLPPPPLEKMSFSCCGADGFAGSIPAGVGQIVLCGLETHVCIAQTALDLLAEGYAVFLAVDAISSRHAVDRDVALRRLEGAGAVPTTSEAVIFEWCRTAAHPRFQDVRKLVL